MAWDAGKTASDKSGSLADRVGFYGYPNFNAPSTAAAWSKPAPLPGAWSPGQPLLGGAAQDTSPSAPTWDPNNPSPYPNANNPAWGHTAAPAAGGAPPGPGAEGVLSGPGVGEQAFAAHGQDFFQPSAFDNWWASHGASFDQPTNTQGAYDKASGEAAPRVSNNAQTAFNDYRDAMPGAMDLPSLAPYYENAKTRLSNSIANEQSARGVYGSSVGAGVAGDAMAGLDAERANREADFEMQKDAARRQWAAGEAGAGAMADSSSAQGANVGLGWQQLLNSLAGGADSSNQGALGAGGNLAAGVAGSDLNRLTGGLLAGGTAQNLLQGREGQHLADVTGAFNMFSGPAQSTYGDMTLNDQGLFESAQNTGLANALNSLNMSEQEKQDFLNNVGAVGKGVATVGGAKEAGLF